ncbi:MAG: DUF4062 domain-containing protein, partial [Verrucomicrobiota bacterium]
MINVFLSAVTKELGSYRAEVAQALREKGLQVKVQEDFSTGPGTLLEKLDAYIQQCHAVICLMGDRYGAEPQDAERIKLGGARHSYTQWEYLQARQRGKATYIFHPESGETPRDPDHAQLPESDELALLQSTFWQTQIIDQDRDRTPFANQTDLVRKVLVCDFVEAKQAADQAPLPPLNTASPYVGLRRFEEKDQAKFYGRTRLIDLLLRRSAESPLLLVTGNSGSGKSSVVRAGMIPKWREGAENQGGHAIVATPNDNPFLGLWSGLLQAGLDGEKIDFVRTPSPTIFRDIASQLGSGTTQSFRPDSAPFLLFIDQFEELFTRIPEKERHLRDTFVAALVDAAQGDLPGLRIILAMRDDFFGNLRDHKTLFPITDANFQRITTMDGAELREIIEAPAHSHGVRFQSGLVKEITEAVEGRTGMLPLLQYTLEALWKEEAGDGGLDDGVLSRQSYQTIGGVTGALQQRVTHFYESKTVDQQRAVRNILLSLVEVSETEEATPVSKAALREDLARDGSEEILKELLNEEKLLISVGGQENEALVELAHEALIRGWEEFEDWVRESKEAIQMRNRLRDDAKRWKNLRGKAAREELWTGSRMERALELENEGEFSRIGGLGNREREFLAACQRDKGRRARVAFAVATVSTLIATAATFATVYAVGQSLLARDAREEADQRRKQSDIAAGKGWLLRAEVAREKSHDVESGFYSARAVGFEGYGKPVEAPTSSQESISQGAVRLDIQEALLRLVQGRSESFEREEEDELRRLFTQEASLEESNEARAGVELARAHPFLWSSVVASHHSSSVNSVAFSPDGETLASASS